MTFEEWTKNRKSMSMPTTQAGDGIRSFEDWTSVYTQGDNTAVKIRGIDDEIRKLEAIKAEYDGLKQQVQTLAPSQSVNQSNRMGQIYQQYGDLDEKLEGLKASKWKYEKEQKYKSLSKKDDFAQKSGYVSTKADGALKQMFSQYGMGYGDLTYEYINGSDDLKADILNKSISFKSDSALDATTAWKKYDLMTDDERRVYNYLYSTEGKASADDYLDYLKYTLDERSTQQTKEKAEAFASEHPVIGSVASVPLNLISGVGTLDIAFQNMGKKLKESVTGEYTGPINYNSDAMSSSVISSTVRGTVAKNIADKTGVIALDENKHPILSKLLNGKSLGDAYQLGMSMADSATVALLSPVLGSAGTVLLGGSAATQGILDAVANGASDEQALMMGVLSGGFEILFEKYELESLLGSDTRVLRSMLKQAVSEGAGESGASIANTLADIIVMAEKSGWQKNINAYMESGLSRKEAEKQAFLDAAIQIGWDFAGGALSGGVMGGGSSVIQNIDANAYAGKAVAANPGGVAALQQAAKDTASELDGSAQKALERLAGRVSTEPATGKGLGSVTAKIRNMVNTQRVGKLYNRTANAITELNAGVLAARLEQGGYSKNKASAVAKATMEAVGGYELDGPQQKTLEKVWEDPVYQQALTEIVKNEQSTVNQRRERIGQVLQDHRTGQETPTAAAPAAQEEHFPTFQEEVRRQFEEAHSATVEPQATYDIDTVFSSVQAARNAGSISEDQYNDIIETLSYAQSDYAEGNITEAEYNGILGVAMRQAGRSDGDNAESAYSASATDPLVNVDRETWQQAQRLAQALGRDIVFYNGMKGENGYFKDGIIYVNILAQDPFAQVVSHELTHSLEGAKHYETLKRFVFAQLAKSGVDIAQARDAKYKQYKSHGKVLENDGEIDSEIVAEYVQNHLLTDEAAITSLVQSEPNVAKRIYRWAKNLLFRAVGPKSSRERAKLEQIVRVYAKALKESQGDDVKPGTVSATRRSTAGESRVDEVQRSRDQTEADFREGRISEEEYDAVMDELDRSENERLGRSLEKYSVGTGQKTTQGGVKYSLSRDAKTELHKALYDRNYRNEVLLRDETPAIMLVQRGVRNLPMAMNASHIRENVFTEEEAMKLGLPVRDSINYHGLGEEFFLQIIDGLDNVKEAYRGTKNADNPARKENYFLLVSQYSDQDGNMVNVPVYIDEHALYNRVFIDTNKISTVFGKKNFRDYIRRQIQQKNLVRIKNRNIATSESSAPIAEVYSSDASETSIRNPDKVVNSNFPQRDSLGNTLSGEQQEYFSDSAARDDDGNLLALYHQTNGDFTIFDTRHPGAGTKDNGTPFGIFMKRSAGDIGLNGKKQMALYANIKNPIRATTREDLARQLREISPRYAAIFDQHKKLDAQYHEKFEQAKKAWVAYIAEWRAANPGASRGALNNDPKFNELYDAEDSVIDEWTAVADQLSVQAKEIITEDLRKAGYDGVFLAEDVGSWGRKTDAIIALDPEQVKNITNKKPTSNPDIRYSFSDALADEEKRRPMEGSYTTDEVEMQARKKGYPVLHGEQVVPFRTWVQTMDRGNYGLVTGMAPENKLLVSFHNKHDGGTADNVAIPYSNLVPVPGTYQMTKEEFASLMASEPLDPGSENLSEEDMRAIEELYHQANGSEEKTVTPIDLDKLPKRVQTYLKRAQRKLLNNLCNTLGVPRSAMQEHLQGIVEEITGEYLNSGTVSDEKLGELFDKAYSQGIVTDREFYDQYKHIKDHLRTTAVTLSEQDRSNIADFQDFRNRQFGRLRIVNQGGLPVDTAYGELQSMAPGLFPENITHPADQLVHMAEVARSIAISKKTLDEFYGPDKETYRSWARNDFDVAVGEVVGDLHALRRFADERATAAAREAAPATPEEAEEAYGKLKKARRTYERATAKNLLTQHDEMLVGRLLRHEMELEHLNPETDNVKGITAVYEAKAEYERLCSLIAKYKRHIHSELRSEADKYLQTASNWKDKSTGIAYSRETMRRNIYDIVADRALARDINEAYFEPVHDAEAKAVRMKDDYRNKVRGLELSRKVAKGNLVSEAHAVQLLGEAEDNIRILENTRGRMQYRDGKTLAEWRAVVAKLWDENPNLDQGKIRDAVQQFRQIYDDLFKHMNRVRVENGYEPINYRSGYFPHFQPGASDGILAQFGRALGIDTQVVALPTTITGLTHTFKPGIQWFGNAQERLGFNTAYDAVEGFDKYIEGAASVIFQTRNIQRLRAFATQVRYRTSDEGIKERVDAVYEDNRLTDEEKQIKIADIYEHGKFELANFVAELDEYTNLLANKKSKYDRTIEALMGRKSYAFLKWWESRVGANMIAGNISSALTNFIPLTQAGAQMDKIALLKGMWKTLASYRTDDGLAGVSTFLTNRRGSDPLVQTWQQKASEKLGILMEGIDQFVSGSIVRGSYYHNLKRGMSESEAMHQADIFASGVMADRSKGAMPTLMQASNPLFKMFTQFQLEVNNQFSEVFKDLPRNHRNKGVMRFALVLFQYFLGAWAFNELYERLMGRRSALDPIGILLDAGKDFADPDVSFGEGVKNLGSSVLSELPFSSGLTLFGFEADGGRIPASSAVPDLSVVWDAATTEGWSAEKRWKELQDELNKLSYVLPPFGGNQVSKIWKGTKAFIEGGSYSVDAEGNDILQYPVYKDDPWSALGALFRATLLGKSSLPEAQEWVSSGFDGLNAKETAVYQDMLDAGISQKEAFALLQELGTARKTDEHSKEAVQRNILRDADASGEGKAIAYYGMLASHDEEDPGKLTERVIMDQLADLGADPWEVTKALMDIKDAGRLEGAEETKAKYDAIIQAALTDEEKTVLVGSITGTEMLTDKGNMTQYAKFKAAVEGGMSVDEYLEFRKVGGDIDDYLGFTNAGLDPDDATDVSLALDELVPLDGKEQVSKVQQWRTCVDTFSNEATQLAALAAKMDDSQCAKLNVAYEYSVSPDTFVTLKEIIPRFDFDGSGGLNQEEVTQAVNSIKGLTSTQRAVLWQISITGKSAKNNPFSVKVGEQVLDALGKG